MPRPSRLPEQRQELLPHLASAFGELGYRRATTAELARRCGVRENILYRHWPDKCAMFAAALVHVHDLAIATWRRVATGDDPAGRLLDHEAEHLGEFGNYRIVFAALAEADDPTIAAALRRLYRGLFREIRRHVRQVRRRDDSRLADDAGAWGIVGLGTIATIGRMLGLFPKRLRRALIADAGRLLAAGR